MDKKIKQYIKTRRVVLVIVFLFFLIRLPHLDKTFLLYDERDTVLTQYSLAKTGKDLYGINTPLQFEHISPHAPPFAMYYGIPFWLAGIPQTVTSSRLIYLLPSSFIPLLVFELLFALLRRKDLSILTSIIFSFSPWVFHISRLALEINIAFPIFLLALFTQIKKRYVFAFFFYFLAFFSYQGIRPLLPSAFIYFELWSYISKKNIRKTVLLSLLFICFFAVLLFISMQIEENMLTRSSTEIVFFARERIQNEVNTSRSNDHNPSLFSYLINNKVVFITRYLIANIMQGLSTAYLFNTGDYVPIYSNSITGQFYPFFALFLLMGLLQLGNKNIREYYMIAGISILGLIPSAINIYSLSFSIRSLFSGVGISFVMAIGLIWFYQYATRLKTYMKYILIGLCSTVILFQVGDFMYRYAFYRPLLQSELYHEDERKLAAFLIQKDKPFTIHLSNPFSYFLSYIFLYPKKDQDITKIQKEFIKEQNVFAFHKNVFKGCNSGELEFITQPTLAIIDEVCISDKTKLLLNTSNKFRYVKLDPLWKGEKNFYIF